MKGFAILHEFIARRLEKAKRQITAARQGIKWRVNKISGKYASQRALIVHDGRVGSTVLGMCLGAHPSIHSDGEVFKPHGKYRTYCKRNGIITPEEFLHLRQYFSSTYLVEIKPVHCRNIGWTIDDAVRSFVSMGFTKFIILERQNILRARVSSRVAVAHRQYHLKKWEKRQFSKVTVDVEKIFASVVESEKNCQLFKDALAQMDTLQLNYEEHIRDDPRVAYGLVCDHLGHIPASTVKVRLKRTNPDTLETMVENYEELRRVFEGTKYAWMLTAD